VIFRWLRNARRRRLWAQPFPEQWQAILERNVRLYRQLTAGEQAKIRDDLRVFVAEKNWEGCGGLTLTDEIRVTIAAQISILVLGFQQQYFRNVLSILIYPNAYIAPDQTITRAGVVLEGDSARSGEAWYRGPVILSWADALAGARGHSGGDNLVFHEFAHQLDMLNGRTANGTPSMQSADQYHRWTETMTEHYNGLLYDCQHGQHTLLDCYGATDLSEFFAVATETFFERPSAMQRRHPKLYDILREFYRQAPAAREAA
jgi:hypothetical protein